MDERDTILFLKEAGTAFKEIKRTADACLEHQKTCNTCGNKAVRFFFRCLTQESLAFDYLVAKVDAEEYFAGLAKLKQEMRRELQVLENENEKKSMAATSLSVGPQTGAGYTPTVGWLEGLYRLRDDRSE